VELAGALARDCRTHAAGPTPVRSHPSRRGRAFSFGRRKSRLLRTFSPESLFQPAAEQSLAEIVPCQTRKTKVKVSRESMKGEGFFRFLGALQRNESGSKSRTVLGRRGVAPSGIGKIPWPIAAGPRSRPTGKGSVNVTPEFELLRATRKILRHQRPGACGNRCGASSRSSRPVADATRCVCRARTKIVRADLRGGTESLSTISTIRGNLAVIGRRRAVADVLGPSGVHGCAGHGS